MSGYLQGQVWFRDVRGSVRDVLLALADHAHDDGTHIYPAMEYLAWKVGVSKRQAQRIVGMLRDQGALIVASEATRYEPTHYRMDLDALPRKAEFRGDRSGTTSASPLPARDDTSADSGVTDPAIRGDVQMSPEPSKETSGETGAKAPSVEKVDLPEDFPGEMRPHLVAVYRILRRVAERDHAKAINPVALAELIMMNTRRPLVEAAGDYASWAADQPTPRKDVLSGYRNWLKKTVTLAGAERLSTADEPHAIRPRRRNPADAWMDHYPTEEAA